MKAIVRRQIEAAGERPEAGDQSRKPLDRTGPRVVIDKLTGLPVVTARPGALRVTSEMVRKLLEDFP